MVFQQVCKKGEAVVIYTNHVDKNSKMEKVKVKGNSKDAINAWNVGTCLRCCERGSTIIYLGQKANI